MLISREMIQQIKDSADIVQIVGEYVRSLKKTGKNWIGLCPFHNDRNPSFSVSQDYGLYKCFSCGESGDVIKFLEKIEGLSFTEAVANLAQRVGIELKTDEETDEKFRKRHDFLVFNDRIVKLFKYFLLEKEEGSEALQYLTDRGINRELIEHFNIGYAPAGFGRIERLLLNKGFKRDFLVSSGLFSSDKGRLKTLFFDRVIFPIINYKNECIGFGGRALKADAKPKYINSPETFVYKKSSSLYGINSAKRAIQDEDRVYVVEGYVDVIACYKVGLKNVVAPCGTAVTGGQLKLLSRYTSNIVMLLDGDEAGLKGASKALKEAANIENITLSVLALPESMDPDDFFKNNDLNYFREFEKQTVDAFDFLIFYHAKDVDIKDYKNLMDVLGFLFDYIKLWESRLVQNSLLERLATCLNLDRGILQEEFDKYDSKGFKKVVTEDKGSIEQEVVPPVQLTPIIPLNDYRKREIDLILLLCSYKDSFELVRKCSLMDKHFLNSDIRELYRLCHEQSFSQSGQIVDFFLDEKTRLYINDRLFSDELQQNDTIIRSNIIDRIRDIIEKYYRASNEKLNEKIKLGVMYKDFELVKELQEEKIINIEEIKKLSKLQGLKA